jgi:pSer/pThr/pTyr-binding forkhead associated (FHA) protein
MAKIVLSIDGVILREMVLTKERLTIGRRPHNDLVIDNSAISAEHAVIVSMLQDAFLEDLNSTNGTRVNGQRIKKHFLKNNDVIELAKYRMRFECGDENAGVHTFLDNSGKRKKKHPQSLIDNADPHKIYGDGNTVALRTSMNQAEAIIKVLNGPDIGLEITLDRSLTTIGQQGMYLAVVTRRGSTYSLTHVQGNAYPFVNGKSIGSSAYELSPGDVIHLAGMEMEFLQRYP